MTRDEAKAMAERLGAKVCRLGVEEDRLSRRRARARLEAQEGDELGVEVIDEDGWFERVEAG